MPWSASRTGVWLAGTLLALFLFRLWFAAALPLTGDEAYFVVWGQRLAGGYYDHPPMVGWWLSFLLQAGRAEWWLRLPAVLLPFLLAWGGWWLVRHEGAEGEERGRLAALLILLQPANVWNVLVTTDTPVVFLSFLSVLSYVHGQRRASGEWARLIWHLLAGMLLGLAFLGKYFAALLGFAYAAHILFVRRDRARWAHLCALTLIALAGPAWNLWWNSSHCWSNIVFNFVNRQGKAGFDWRNPLVFWVSMAYLVTPWLLWMFWRHRQVCSASLARLVRTNSPMGSVPWLAGVPLLAFFALSFVKSVGLHWLLAFMPLVAVLAAVLLPVSAIRGTLRFSAAFALLHVLAALVLLALPTSVWKGSAIHADAVLTLRGAKIEQALREPLARCGEGCILSMESYSAAATLAYAVNRPVVIFGDGSFHGRQDDFDTDLRTLAGRDFLILRKETVRRESYSPFFDRVDVASFEVEGVMFHAVHAQGFRFDLYHERMLTRVRDRFYRIPAWLPQAGCPFTDRYFPAQE